MNDSILERLKTLIAACPHLEKAKVYTDFVREDEICCGIFPVGEKRLSADWAGNERWQYDFTIQKAFGQGRDICFIRHRMDRPLYMRWRDG